jgi:hypothetical protein
LSLKDVTREAAREAETDAILDVLSYTRWNRRKTAGLLKISYKALLNKIKEYQIEDKYRQMVRGQTTEVRGQMAAISPSTPSTGPADEYRSSRSGLATGSRH